MFGQRVHLSDTSDPPYEAYMNTIYGARKFRRRGLAVENVGSFDPGRVKVTPVRPSQQVG